MKYIVTGGAGFIGSALCLHLSQDPNSNVLIIDRLTYAAAPGTVETLTARANITLVNEDVRDAAKMLSLVEAFKPDVIFHLAAETHVDRSIDSALPFVETNVLGTHNMLEAARAYAPHAGAGFRFVHVSTDEVFGALSDTGQFDEDTKYDPSSPYSASKAGSDHLVRAWHRTYDLPVVISNCSNNYGPRQFPEKLIPLMVLNCLEGASLPVYGQGRQVRDWLSVEDHARALVDISQRGKIGDTYVVGGGAERANIDVVKTICGIMDDLRPAEKPYEDLIRFVDDRPGHDFRYSVDASKISTALGWAPHVDFEDGLKQTVAWYLENSNWWRPLRETLGAGERLGQTTNA